MAHAEYGMEPRGSCGEGPLGHRGAVRRVASDLWAALEAYARIDGPLAGTVPLCKLDQHFPHVLFVALVGDYFNVDRGPSNGRLPASVPVCAQRYQRQIIGKYAYRRYGPRSRETEYDHVVDAVLRYVDSFNRPVMVTNRAKGGFTGTHRLLRDLVRFVATEGTDGSNRPWRDAELERITADATPLDDILSVPLQRLARRLRRLSDQESAAVATSIDGGGTGYQKGSVSPLRRQTEGAVALSIGGTLIPVPEELCVFDVFGCLPGALSGDLFDQRNAGLTDIERHAKALAEAEGAPLAPAHRSDAIAALRASHGLSDGYEIWDRFDQLVETLNEPYGKKVVRLGLPAEIGLKLSMTRADTLATLLTRAKELAQSAGAGAYLDEPAFREAWIELSVKSGGKRPGYPSYEAFLHSEEGQWMVFGDPVRPLTFGRDQQECREDDGEIAQKLSKSQECAPDPDPLGIDRVSNPEDPALAWQELARRGEVTTAEATFLTHLTAGNFAETATVKDICDAAYLSPLVAGHLSLEFPYAAIRNEADRFNVFLWFAQRRAKLLNDPEQIKGAMTAAEKVALTIEWPAARDRKPTSRHRDIALKHSVLRALLTGRPYAKHLDFETSFEVFWFFFARDVLGSGAYPAF